MAGGKGRAPATLANLKKHAAEKGNTRAVKHLGRSDLAIIPVREERARVLRAQFPQLDDLRLALLADRLARIAVASAWLDQQENGVVRDKRGNVFDVADKVEAWSRAAEKILAEIEAESRGAKKLDLASLMSALEDGDDG
jgi:hypothetical protein